MFDYSQNKSVATDAARTSLIYDFERTIECTETLSFWVNVKHKYIAEPLRYDSKEESLTLDANGKKQQSLKSITIKLYLNNTLVKSSVIPISNYQGSVSILSNTSVGYEGWGYKTPRTITDVVGWKLLKIPTQMSAIFNRVEFVLNTYDYYPNMDINIGHIVCDQKMMPMLCITTDGNLYNDKSARFANWCIEHHIPRSAQGVLLDDSSLSDSNKELNAKLKEQYINGEFEITVYNRDVKLRRGLKESLAYLKGDEGGWTGSVNNCLDNYYMERPCISINSSIHYLDDIIVNAEKMTGFRIMRGAGELQNGGTSYLDDIDSVIYCGNLMNETSAAINAENYDSVLANRINQGKASIDRMIAIGESVCQFSHFDLYKEDCIKETSGAFAEALEEVLTYAKTKESEGELMIVTMDKLYKLCTNNY